MQGKTGVNFSPPTPPAGQPVPGGKPPRNWYEGKAMLPHIAWRRPSADERRWWVVQGAVILGGVLLIGLLMVLALR